MPVQNRETPKRRSDAVRKACEVGPGRIPPTGRPAAGAAGLRNPKYTWTIRTRACVREIG